MLEMPQMIQTWKEVSHIVFDLNYKNFGLTTCSEGMAVDGRNGPNKRGVYQAEGMESVQYVCRALLGAHCKEDGVHIICQLSSNAWLCSTSLYQNLSRIYVTALQAQ